MDRIAAIRGILSDSLRCTHEEDKKELSELRDTLGYHSEKRKESLLQKLMVHNPKRHRLGIAAVRDMDGNIIFGKDESQRFLGGFLGKKFEEKPIDECQAGIFVKKFSKAFPDTCWIMSWLCFLSMMTGLSKTSPGPDGIAYGGWQCNFFTQVSIYLGYMCWIHTGYLPAFFNISFIWLLPKTSPIDGCFAPGDTRPLTGSNCDVKIFAMMLADSINNVIDKWAFRAQRGFIRGRCMLQNVVDVETKALIFARNRDNSSALFFFDFAAAFPSIARAFIWIALIAIGFPRNVVAGIRALYKNNLHFVRTSSGLKFVFVAESGVMQGSPLSSLIFVLVTDCINRYLATLLGINDLLLAYADDLALIIEHFFDHGVSLAEAFEFIGSICALRLNANKCVCIPLCNKDRWHLYYHYLSSIPSWCEFMIKDHGKYLGFYVGPGALSCEWDSIGKKMTEVANLVKNLGLPRMQAIILYNILAVSKALFVAQIRMPSKKFLKLCNTLAISILGGPGSWVPRDLPFVLKRFFCFPVEIGHMETLCFASRIRTSICTIPRWGDSWKALEDSKRFSTSNVRHPMNNWIENSGIFVMSESCKQFSIEDFAIFCLREGVADCPVREIPKIQNRICNFTGNRFIEFDMKDTFIYRFNLRAWFDNVEVHDLAFRAVSFYEDIRSHVPPCVLFAVINTMFNGWTTDARFQNTGSRCVLCRECIGEDSLDHYASCISTWRIFLASSENLFGHAQLIDFLDCEVIL